MIPPEPSPSISPTPSPVAGARGLLLCILAAVASFVGAVLYLNALHNPFVYDDFRLVVDNPALRDLSNLRGIVLRDILRPVVNLSYALDTAVWGNQPFGYHLTNILLHALNIALVFRVVLVASEDRSRRPDQVIGAAASPTVAAFAAALLFAVHPMMTEAVGFVSGRSEVACASLFLLAFLAGRRWLLLAGWGWWLACIGLWTVSLLAKETAAMLPFVLVAYSWLLLDPPPPQRWRLLLMGSPILVVSVAAVAIRVAVLLFVENRSGWFDWHWGPAAADALWRYLGLFVYPHDQAVFHAIDLRGPVAQVRIAASVAALLAVPWMVWRLRSIHSVMALGGLWFVLMLLPSSALFALGVGEPLAEHRGYLPAVGLFMAWGSAMAMLWVRASDRTVMRVAVVTIAALFVFQLSVQTLVRNAIWSDPAALAQESVDLAPGHFFPLILLGDAHRRAGRCDDAIEAYQKVLALRPEEENVYDDLGICFMQQHRFDEAEALMLELRGRNPASRDADVTLGLLATLKNDLVGARAYFTQALDHHPDLAVAHGLLATVSGNLPPDKRRRACEELGLMAEDFDVGGCLARQPTPAPVLLDGSPSGS